MTNFTETNFSGNRYDCYNFFDEALAVVFIELNFLGVSLLVADVDFAVEEKFDFALSHNILIINIKRPFLPVVGQHHRVWASLSENSLIQ